MPDTFHQSTSRRIIVALTPDDVARLAGLARIDLTEEEKEDLAPQLGLILDSVAVVSQVASADVPPSSHALPLSNVFREDVVAPSMPVDDALAMSPKVEDNRFRVPRILQEEQ